MKEHIYKVEGMHCASCEILIEKKLLEIKNVKSVNASVNKGEVVIEYESDRPNPERLSKIFKEENYIFFDKSKDFNKVKTIESSGAQKRANPTLV
jgi:copper chaperone CopZ